MVFIVAHSEHSYSHHRSWRHSSILSTQQGVGAEFEPHTEHSFCVYSFVSSTLCFCISLREKRRSHEGKLCYDGHPWVTAVPAAQWRELFNSLYWVFCLVFCMLDQLFECQQVFFWPMSLNAWLWSNNPKAADVTYFSGPSMGNTLAHHLNYFKTKKWASYK